ncbi:TonB-dependent receptor [uncultured Bacteroides sp.]|uniref:SusC/RagA family TonB-linked outer membrane protein n=1 Tax=uncultured Bacteroides sp. TaxID=162156 RepID=UPI002676FF15|nr:TonB-dependent receptor [uncultured Bacteroides sp.]
MKRIIILLLALMPLAVWAQVTVRGTVKDDLGEVLVGATILEVNSPGNGTITDIDGKFSIKLKSAKAKIKVSYIGYAAQTVTATDGMVITMQSDGNMLQEVEIVQQGFGTKSRLSNIASISQVNGMTLRQSPTSTVQNALAGRLPGLFQLQGSGQPGKDAADIFIRGIGTYADVSTSPLVLIDDVESDISTLSQLSPNDIQDISVLKDAGSTAIFGLKGANGVILVTTRRGTEGKPKITFRADVGFQQPTYKNTFLDSYESLKLIKEMYINDADQASLDKNQDLFSDEALEHFRTGDSPYLYPNVDWYDLMYKKSSMVQQYNVDVQGGTDKVKYFVAIGYTHQTGLLKDIPKEEDFNNDYYLKRYNLRSNFDIQITKDFLFKINANAILSELNEPYLPNPGQSGTFSIFTRLLGGHFTPWNYPAYNPDGTFGMKSGESMNPLALMSQGGYDREWKNNVNGNITLEHKLDFITKGLKIRGVMALTNRWGTKRTLHRGTNDFLAFYRDAETGSYLPINQDVYVLRPMTVSESISSPYLQINSRVDLSYNRKFGGHNVGALLLANWYSNRTGSGTPGNSMSYSTRISYDYNSRYLVEFSGTYNGSDRFSKNNRFDFFPSISLGWNLAEEPYAKSGFNAMKVNMLKLRGSYGLSGSDAVPGDKYVYVESYKKNYDYPFGEDPRTTAKIPAYFLETIGNDNVRWEVEKKLNLGIDLRMFDSRLSATFEYFYNRRNDILSTPMSIPLYAGYMDGVLPMMNIGRTENKGWDAEFTWRDKIGNDFSYFFRGIVSHAKNKIIEMGEAPSPYVLSMETGKPIGTIFGYVAEGFYNTQEEIDNGPVETLRTPKPGDLRYKDISGPQGVADGVINEYDKVAIGNSRPDFNYGLTIGFSYKNFDLSTLFQGATGASLSLQKALKIGSTDGRPRPLHLGRWTDLDENGNKITDSAQLIEMNKNATFPILSKDHGHNAETSTFWLRSANYIRWKNLEIGYRLPETWVRKVGLNSVRFYGSAQNLMTWSELGDYQVDPESSRLSNPVDTYPQQRVYNLGCQIVF